MCDEKALQYFQYLINGGRQELGGRHPSACVTAAKKCSTFSADILAWVLPF